MLKKSILLFTAIYLSAVLCISAFTGMLVMEHSFASGLVIIGDQLGLKHPPPDTKLFDINNMYPGKEETSTVAVENKGEAPFCLLVSAKKHAGDTILFDGLLIKATGEDGTVHYSGPLNGLYQKGLGTILAGEVKEFAFTISFPELAGNEQQGKTLAVKFVFLAQQQPAQHSIGVSSNPPAGGSVTGGGKYDHGQQVKLIATASEGYIFVNWTEAGVVVGTSHIYTFTADRNRDLTANYTATANPAIGGAPLLFIPPAAPEPMPGEGWEIDETTELVTAVPEDGVAVFSFPESGVRIFVRTHTADGVIAVTRYYHDDLGTPAGMLPMIYLRIDRSDTLTGAPVRIEIKYDADELPAGVDENDQRIYRYNEAAAAWDLLADQGVDAPSGIVWANLTDFSVFAIFFPEPKPAPDPVPEDIVSDPEQTEIPATPPDTPFAKKLSPAALYGACALVVLLAASVGLKWRKKLKAGKLARKRKKC